MIGRHGIATCIKELEEHAALGYCRLEITANQASLTRQQGCLSVQNIFSVVGIIRTGATQEHLTLTLST